MKATCCFTLAILAIAACPALGDLGSVGSSGETNFVTILNNIYGAGFAGASWGGSSYSNGSVMATRVDDNFGGLPGTSLNLTTGPGAGNTDQWWTDGIAPMTAKARFAGDAQRFGYYQSGTYTQLFAVSGSGFAVTGSATHDFTGSTWAWYRDNDGTTPAGAMHSVDSMNVGSSNHMLTYHITGVNNGALNTWLLFFEDRDGGDNDFNDLVVEVTAVPAPAAFALGALGLGLVGWAKRRQV